MRHRPSATRVGERIEVTGVVQGVGFRPFVHRLATELGLGGVVGNDSSRVFIEVFGADVALDEFAARLSADAPPLARIERVDRRRQLVDVTPGFRIVDSRVATGARTLVPPDTAVCRDCLRELFDLDDRRAGHPFITCTNCGPRFTIIRDLPYDRPATTMSDFEMCPACTTEYADPSDRRYHAQPIACHDCGPALVFVDDVTRWGDAPTTVGRDAAAGAIAGAADALRGGATVAVKGLGGYHLACDATDAVAVARLRDRKHRPDKPFAVMAADLDAVAQLADPDDAERAELCSPARPIVLLRASATSPLASNVAPANPLVGVMLPYTPVHHLLFAAGLPPLVMTSGNLGGEPITHRDEDAPTRLAPLCDALLTHDRPIHVPCDDSVVRIVDGDLLPVRRARGYAPVPVPLRRARRAVLAVGAELKNTCCVTSTDHAWVSQHLGDMENLETLRAFESTVSTFASMYAVAPELVAADAHPGYSTSRWAHRHHGDRVVDVQHHHAHVASIMAEHELPPDEPVIGFAFDGTGYGSDAAIWGGEVLVADATGFERVAHLRYVPLPGGDAAIRAPARVALTHLRAAGVDWADDLAPVRRLAADELRLLERQLDVGTGCVPTSSMGRLFDAIASLLDLRHHISFEAQAAIDLEIAAETSTRRDRGHRFGRTGGSIDAAPLVVGLVDDLRRDVEVGVLAWTFHVAVAELVGDVAAEVLATRRGTPVALTGGVFQNALVTSLCRERLRRHGVVALTHRLVPPNDGGLALGQAYVAAHRSGVESIEEDR